MLKYYGTYTYIKQYDHLNLYPKILEKMSQPNTSAMEIIQNKMDVHMKCHILVNLLNILYLADIQSPQFIKNMCLIHELCTFMNSET